MSKRQLCHEARRIGVAPNDVEQFLDDEISKEQFIELVVGKMPDPRNDLRAMSKKELRLEAEKLGVSAADIERFRFDEIGTSQFIELVVDRIEVRHKTKKIPADCSANASIRAASPAISLFLTRPSECSASPTHRLSPSLIPRLLRPSLGPTRRSRASPRFLQPIPSPRRRP